MPTEKARAMTLKTVVNEDDPDERVASVVRIMCLLHQNIRPRTIETMVIMSAQSSRSMSLLSPLHFRYRMYPDGHTHPCPPRMSPPSGDLTVRA
ncbi:protein of unknown function [Azospirillum baldaniorum]|uniref:Uncharacterized protein n=1 Tax=Azospirillum baldaniorum TaxID=1064539 RepID=A0A9P1JQI7_9PROT|nr:protein of unknown function [Azospirillum baldaniorum]